VDWRDCKCVKNNSGTESFITTAGWFMVDVDPPEILPGSTNVFTIQDTSSMDAMKFLFGDGGTVIDSLEGGAFGQMMIAFDTVAPPITGTVLDFQLNFPSYDILGHPTGTNHWGLASGSPLEVVYDFHHDAFVVESGDALLLEVHNDLLPPRFAWMALAIRDFAPGRSAFMVTEAEELPGLTEVEEKEWGWGTIKALYR
jgi:hypothetical protein